MAFEFLLVFAASQRLASADSFMLREKPRHSQT